MAALTTPDYSHEASVIGATRRNTSRPRRDARRFASMAGEGALAKIMWSCLSIGLFVGLWELCWLFGWADPKLLPPPHIFIGSIADQGKFFNTATRWQVGRSMTDGPSAFESVMVTIGA